jgi:hypothetical protein
MSSTPHPAAHVYQVRTPRSRPRAVLAVLVDGPSDVPTATHAAAVAARDGVPVIVVAVVRGTGFSVNPRLHHVRGRRVAADSAAIMGRVAPTLDAAGIGYTATTLLVPAGVDPSHALPAKTVRRLADRERASVVVCAATLRDTDRNLDLIATIAASDARNAGRGELVSAAPAASLPTSDIRPV